MKSILDLPSVRARVSRTSVEEYHRQPEFNENGKRTELIRGLVLEKMSDLVIRYALGEAEPPWRRDHRWWKYVERAAAPAT